MEFRKTPISGAFIIESNPFVDDRGSFYRTFCQREFESHGIEKSFVQSSISRNKFKGTLRGMHFQSNPTSECKLVRCIRGKAFDVIVDIRPESPSFLQNFAIKLDEKKPAALFIPPGIAHGFITLVDNTDMLYQMSAYYEPNKAHGYRWDDPAFNIRWPTKPKIISAADENWINFNRYNHGTS
jgi:dTDP-4-dehydrorhamnose 3,5-epimerase